MYPHMKQSGVAITAIAVLIVLLFAIAQFNASPQQAAASPPVFYAIAQNTGASGSGSSAGMAAARISDPATSTPPSKEAAAQTAVSNAAITLAVGVETYAAPLPASRTVLDTMKALQASRPGFTFTGSDFPSLGFFVESINGKKAASGYNWMLYINGRKSDVGASQAVIHAGDRIEWKYEQ